MSENKSPFRGENPFDKDRDLIYRHIGFTKRVTWNYQYFVMGVLTLLMLLRLVSRLRNVKSPQKERPHRLTIFLQSQPSSSLLRCWFKTNGTLINISLFYLINLFILFYNLPLNDPFNFALRAGLVSASNVPLLYLIPLKSGPLLHFLQHSYENIMVYHKWIGIFVVLTALIHGSVFVYLLTWEYCSTNQHMLTGYFCMSMFLLISMSSVKVTRAKFYEIFYYIHLGSFTMFLLVFFFHHYVCKTFVMVVICLLVYDRFARYLLYFWCLKCNVALVKDDKYMVVTISPELYNLPRMQRVISYCLLKLKKNFSWEPSNHLFIAIPAVDVFQSHPFTISSLESEGKCQLLIQVHDGFTKRLYNRVRKGETEFMCIINGPYGSSHLHLPDTDNHASKHLMSIRNETTSLIQSKGDMVTMTTLDPILYSSSFSSMSSAQKEKIILVAGGIGLSLTLPLLRRYQKMAQYDLSFIWITRCESLAPLVGLDESQPNVRIWNSTKHGRPVMIQLLLDSLNGEYRMIHIIGCGPTSLMSSVRQFATERMNHSNVNLVLEEFSF